MTTKGAARNPLHVLVVDDEDAFREAVATCLRSAGYEVATAPNGQAARNLIALEQKFVAVVSDIRMSPVNGIELLHFIKKERANLPVILMTGFAEIAETQEAFTLGADGFLAKPFKSDELLAQLRSLTGQKAPEEIKEENQDAEYCKLMLEDFISGRQIKFDIYVRLSNSKYVKIAHQGEDISMDRIKAYKEKGVQYLYMRKEDFAAYIGFNVNLTQLIRDKDAITKQKRLSLIKHTGEILLEHIYVNGLDEQNAEYAKNAIESTVSVVSTASDALTILDTLRSHGDFLYSHGVAVSMYSVLIAKGMQWHTPATLFKVSMSGLFHDIGKKEIELSILMKSRNSLTPEELRLIESHPMRGLELLSRIKGISGDVLQSVLQHHENCAGLGYPYGISKSKIHPFARLIAVADKFCNLVLPGPDGEGISPHDAIAQIQECYTRELDMAFLPALKSLFPAPPVGKRK